MSGLGLLERILGHLWLVVAKATDPQWTNLRKRTSDHRLTEEILLLLCISINISIFPCLQLTCESWGNLERSILHLAVTVKRCEYETRPVWPTRMNLYGRRLWRYYWWWWSCWWRSGAVQFSSGNAMFKRCGVSILNVLAMFLSKHQNVMFTCWAQLCGASKSLGR